MPPRSGPGDDESRARNGPQNGPTPSHPWSVGNTVQYASVIGLVLKISLWWVGFSTRPYNNDRAAPRLAANQPPATPFPILPPVLSDHVPNRPRSTSDECAASGHRQFSKNNVAKPNPASLPRFAPVFGKPGRRP